ncbi:SRPBCC family protein [Dactylosporangium sp. NPDC051541]|uniref:SRPBCC family protein n=1 Tax=Dactylosporangium sp. NPDC051541 TaxID=3363977 RepID=UPI00378A72B2
MATFTTSAEVHAPAEQVWAALTDWRNHARWAPLTTVRLTTERMDGLGAGFVARSGIGPLGFDDPMTVVRWEPPTAATRGRCDVDKHGRVIRGKAWFEVVPLEAGRCRVDWSEDVTVVPHRLDKLTGGLVALVGRAGFGQALRKMAREFDR